MDIIRLRSLRELARQPTMAAVADTLFLTPSAVSQQIAQLEAETGIALTERVGRGVRLTPAGEKLAAHADRLFDVLDEARSDMAALRRDVSGRLRIAVFPTAGTSFLPAAIQKVEQRHPHLQIVLEELEPADGIAALGSRHCDLAFIDDLTVLGRADRGHIEQHRLLDDALYALLPTGHHLAGRASITLSELKDERWALDSARSSFADYVLSLCRDAGYEPNINAHCQGFEILQAMVGQGLSVSVVAGLRLKQRVRGVAAVRLAPQINRRIAIAYRSGERRHPAIRSFLEVLDQSVSHYLRPRPHR